MIETPRLKKVVIFFQTILSFVLSTKMCEIYSKRYTPEQRDIYLIFILSKLAYKISGKPTFMKVYKKKVKG